MKTQLIELVETPDLISPMAINFLKGMDLLQFDNEKDMYVLTSKTVKTNMAICKKCKTCVISFFRHDFVRCNCDSEKKFIAVDGGADYNRRCGDPGQFLYPTTK